MKNLFYSLTIIICLGITSVLMSMDDKLIASEREKAQIVAQLAAANCRMADFEQAIGVEVAETVTHLQQTSEHLDRILERIKHNKANRNCGNISIQCSCIIL